MYGKLPVQDDPVRGGEEGYNGHYEHCGEYIVLGVLGLTAPGTVS